LGLGAAAGKQPYPRNIPAVAPTISAALAQPSTRSHAGSTRLPITECIYPSTTIAMISGPATTPLITADQNSACIGSIGENTIPAPSKVAPASVP
jgi:hypothetical protein